MSADRMTGDVLGDTYEVKFHQEAFLLKKTGTRVDAFVPGQKERFGYVRLSTPRSGSIWLHDDCIGECEKVKEDWTITPISRGRLDAGTTVRKHPVDFLLESYVTDSTRGARS